MLQWAKLRTVETRRQAIPCRAGRLVGIVYANGDVGVCENRPPLGNLRRKSFGELWDSDAAQKARRSISAGECNCTYEMYLWPSIIYQPLRLIQAAIGARVWRSWRPRQMR
jgi:AdoMet-dependent heme synthase